MRKAVIVITVLIFGLGGYLGWDWHAKTQKQKLEPSISLYYWTDSKGEKHYSDSPPPKNARDVYIDKGYRHIKAPLIVTFKNKAAELYKKTKKKLWGSGKTQKK